MNSTSGISLSGLELNSTLQTFNCTTNNCSEAEVTLPNESAKFKLIIDYVVFVVVIVCLISMGCDITKEQTAMNSTSGISLSGLELNSTLQTFNCTTNNCSEAEVTLPNESAKFKLIIDYVVFVSVIVCLISMGCDITKEQLLHHIKRPIGVCIGMFGQFVVMPLTGFLLTQISGLSILHATGILVISCCPGGNISNMFTYFWDGDVSLSVTMTAMSTFAAMGMMPLNLWIYGRSIEREDLVIPYVKLAISLVLMTSPVTLGIIIRWKWPRTALFVTKVGACISLILLIILTALLLVWFPDIYFGGSGRVYGVIFSFPLIGCTLGYVLAWVFKQTVKLRKTIAIETGFQNIPIAMAVIALSFPLELQEDILRVPLLHGTVMMILLVLISTAYQVYKRYVNYKTEKFQRPPEGSNDQREKMVYGK